LHTNNITKLSVEGGKLMVYNEMKISDAGPIAATSDGHLCVCWRDKTSVAYTRDGQSCNRYWKHFL